MRERMGRRVLLAALCLYGLATVADIALHLRDDTATGEVWWAPDNLIVAFSAGLFWPIDLVARELLAL
jgi:hypothetical protein